MFHLVALTDDLVGFQNEIYLIVVRMWFGSYNLFTAFKRCSSVQQVYKAGKRETKRLRFYSRGKVCLLTP